MPALKVFHKNLSQLYTDYHARRESTVSQDEPASQSENDIDHSYCTSESPKSLKRKLVEAHDHIDALRKKLKNTQQKTRRLRKKVTSLKDVVNMLKDKNHISSNGAEMLMKTFPDVPSKIMKKTVINRRTGKLSCTTYSPALRAFALSVAS